MGAVGKIQTCINSVQILQCCLQMLSVFLWTTVCFGDGFIKQPLKLSCDVVIDPNGRKIQYMAFVQALSTKSVMQDIKLRLKLSAHFHQLSTSE